MGIINGKTICQVALVVKDIETVSKKYAKLFGVEVPDIFTVPPQEESHTKYRGVPTNTRAKLAVFDLGQIVLELTQPDEDPSSWKEQLDEKGDGVHHIAFMTEDRTPIVEYFEENAMPIRHYGEYSGGNYTVFDSAKDLGVLIQVKEEKKRED